MVAAAYTAMHRVAKLYRRHITRFVAPADFTRDWMIEHLPIEPDRITTVPHIVEYPDSAADPASGSYVAYAGRLVPEKGVHTFLDALHGTGIPARVCRNAQHFQTIEVPDDIRVEVTHGRDDLAAFYRNARVIVVPSLWFESFGLVGAEAMAHGVPIIVSDIGAVQNLVEDGKDGLLFRTGDHLDLRRKIRELWYDPQRCSAMGAKGRAKAHRLWSGSSHADALIRVYKDALAASALG